GLKLFRGGHEFIYYSSQNLLPSGPGRKWEVHGETLTRTLTRFIGPARSGIKRPLMSAEKQYRRIGIEDILRAVAVVHIPVYDQHLFQPQFTLRITRPDGDIVKKAKTHSARGIAMMA